MYVILYLQIECLRKVHDCSAASTEQSVYQQTPSGNPVSQSPADITRINPNKLQQIIKLRAQRTPVFIKREVPTLLIQLKLLLSCCAEILTNLHKLCGIPFHFRREVQVNAPGAGGAAAHPATPCATLTVISCQRNMARQYEVYTVQRTLYNVLARQEAYELPTATAPHHRFH